MANEITENIDILQQEKPLIILLKLDDGNQPGRYESVNDFAEKIAVVTKRYPDVVFSYVPFSYINLPENGARHTTSGLFSMLMIETQKK